MSYLSNFFVSIDQLGNVLAGGNPDNTISSRVGYYTRNSDESKIPFQWKLFRNIINATFWPIDGPNHCREAYLNDAGEEFDEGTSDIAVAVLAILIIVSCVFVATFLYLLYAFRIVSPRHIDRNKNIKNRLTIAEAKLNGALTELNTHKVVVDQELDAILDETQSTLTLISEKINGILDFNRRLESFKSSKTDEEDET